MYYAYILRCADGTLYSGYACDLARRVKAHNNAKGAKYTRARVPVELVYSEGFETKSEAMQRENQFKRMTRKEKLALFESPLT